MPPRLNGSLTLQDRLGTAKRKDYPQYRERYPEGVELKPGTKIHDKLAAMILTRATDSHTAISQRFSTWNDIDKTLTTYIDLSASDTKTQTINTKRAEKRPISIVFPNSYAILETMLSYMVMAFFQDPIFRYVGNNPESVIGAMLMERVIQQQCEYSKVPLALHTMFRDNFAYGIGIAAPTWKVTTGKKPIVRPVTVPGALGGMTQAGREIEWIDATLHEGNALINIDPYLYLPDPSVAVNNVQDGEFVGWLNSTNLMNLLSEEQNDDDLFNVNYLRHVETGQSSLLQADNSRRTQKTGVNKRDSVSNTYKTTIDTITLYVKLIPRDWNLGDSDYPEVWLFELAADSIIVRARELGDAQGKFPIVVSASESDGYSATPISRLEVLNGLQDILNWLFNSHIANVRKALNDMFIVDPGIVNINDLKDPEPGKLIRTRRPHWGQGVQHAIQQFQVHDVTRGNMADSQIISQLMQSLSGTDNPMMGNLRQGGPERLTGAEFQGTMAGAVSRLERVARLTSYQALQDMAMMFASNVQQFMDEDAYIQTVGSWPEKLSENFGVGPTDPISVSPFDLIIDYNVRPRDGSIPGGNFSQAWIQLYQILGNSPELAQRFDMVRIFKHIAVNLGAKNVDRFERQEVPQVAAQPDQQVAAQVQQGNLAPTQEVLG